jgi:hypothetical protein
MKKYSLFLIVVFLLSIGSSFQLVSAQEKAKSEQEKEAEIQKAIELQKKAILEQKRAVEEATKTIVEQKAIVDDETKDVQIRVESSGRGGSSGVRVYSPRGNRSMQFDEPFSFSSSGVDIFNGRDGIGGDTERTTWDFSKSVKENTFTKTYAFEVEKTVNTVVMSVMGDCKAGEIRIKILMPSGKNYSDIVIDEFGNLNWRKSFTISETENQDKAGEWKFQITSTKATGFFKISLQTY